MPRAIHQLVAGYSNGDAISDEARRLRAVLRARGFASEIYCDPASLLPQLRGDARDIGTLARDISPDDGILLHLSIGSPANEVFRTLRARKVLRYHNITPAEFFRAVNGRIADRLAAGREQARTLAGVAEVNLAVSAFNARELIGWGYRDPVVLPLFLDFTAIRGSPDRAVVDRYADGLVNLLFVGRGVPNKRIDDILRAFGHYQRMVNRDSRFIHAGSYAGTEPYVALLHTLKIDLELENVDFLGPIPEGQLHGCYASARVFLCMSEHEGFCIPLLEAMAWDVPVLAFDAGAVAETLDGAGVLFREKDHRQVAEMIHRLASPGPFREAVLAGQRARLERYRARDLGGELMRALAPVLG